MLDQRGRRMARPADRNSVEVALWDKSFVTSDGISLRDFTDLLGNAVIEEPYVPPADEGPLRDADVGSYVRIPIDGILRDVIIVHKGVPSAAYVGLENTVTVLSRRVLFSMAFHSGPGRSHDYQNSGIHAHLNNENVGGFLTRIDAPIRNRILQVRIPFRPGNGGDSVVVSQGSNGLLVKCFILSITEAGMDSFFVAGSGGSLPNSLGTRLSFFIGDRGSYANQRRRAQSIDTNSYVTQFTRTPILGVPGPPSLPDQLSMAGISANGVELNIGTVSDSVHGVRPAFVLPDNLLINANGEVLA